MARDLELVKLRDARIREVFARMSAQRIGHRQRYSTEYIIYHISTKHAFVSSKVVERVLSGEDDRHYGRSECAPNCAPK